MLLQDGLAAGVHDAGGGADLGVVDGVDVVHEEIDQTALGLEGCQEADDFGLGVGLRWGGAWAERPRRGSGWCWAGVG